MVALTMMPVHCLQSPLSSTRTARRQSHDCLRRTGVVTIQRSQRHHQQEAAAMAARRQWQRQTQLSTAAALASHRYQEQGPTSTTKAGSHCCLQYQSRMAAVPAALA